MFRDRSGLPPVQTLIQKKRWTVLEILLEMENKTIT